MFRYGTITAIDYDLDTCSVTLDTLTSSQQGLDINQDIGLSDVPIEYMDCNSAAFAVDDEVVVEFTPATFPETTKKVIGFKSDPAACGRSCILIISSEDGSEAVAWNLLTDSVVSSGTYATVSGPYTPVEIAPTTTETINTGSSPGVNQTLGSGLPAAYAGGSVGLVDQVSGVWPIHRPINQTVGVSYFIIDLACFSGGTGWIEGDTVVFSTIAGSGSITINGVNTVGGTFDSSKLTVNSVGAITETWAIRLFELSSNLYFTIEGATVGTLYDFGCPDNVYSMPYPRSGWDYDHGYIEMAEFEDKLTTAYLWRWWGDALKEFGSTDIMEDDFISETGNPWPTGENYVELEYIFFNPVFGVDLSSGSAYLSQMQCATDGLYQSWRDADWASGIKTSNMDAWCKYGLATKGTIDVICSAYSICTDIGTGDECNDYVDRFESEMQIFYRLDGSVALSTGGINVLELINAERVSAGKGTLSSCPNLQAAAQRHADDMAANGFVGHTGSDSTDATTRILQADYLLHRNSIYQSTALAENCASADLSQTTGTCTATLDGSVIYESEGGCSFAVVVAGWMESAGHSANILYDDFTDTGIGIAISEGGITYICQTFGWRQNKWAGFGPFNTENLKTWIDSNFTWTGSATRLPKIYLT